MIRDLLAYQLEASSPVQFLRGHWVVDNSLLQRHTEKWDFVTVLRDPVERWLSNYFYDRYKSTPNFRVHDDLETFLDDDCARWYGTTYVRHLTACRFDTPVKDKDIAAACDNLKRFASVGFLSNLSGFSADLRRQFLIRASFRRRRRTSPATDEQRQRQLSPDLMEQIRELCAPDLAVYDYARRNYSAEAVPQSGASSGSLPV